ncbi:MAG: glycoside hydrolase family 1 protein [Candidatus Dormibacteraeota bacterium]|nr:glycoside hydrolase family 1 protein [Candidatus Dormibacteraeota bacterium]
MTRRFPEGFLWGCATAAHQVEGGSTNNNWWRFEQEGHILTGESSLVANDHWHRYREDFALLSGLHNNAHRLSIEWSKVEPEPGRFDEGAIEHYRDVLRELRRLGMTPVVTLLHFTTPLWFEDRGGWAGSGAVDAWLPFVERVARSLGDLAGLWCTINEPNIMALMGWVGGEFPPGRLRDLRGFYRVLRNLRQAHEAAYRLLHRITPGIGVGLAHNLWHLIPERLITADRLAAAFGTAVTGRWPLRPWRWPEVVTATCDWVGLNHYTGELVRFDPTNPAQVFTRRTNPSGLPESDFGWVLNPRWMRRALRQLAHLRKPVYITESGVSVHDDRIRVAYLPQLLGEVWGAIQEGVDVRGYLHWTAIDNFEWAHGYSQPFGLIAFDPLTQERTVKPSGELFARIAARNALD